MRRRPSTQETRPVTLSSRPAIMPGISRRPIQIRVIVPVPSTIFQDGDLLYVAVHNDREGEVEKLFESPPEKH